MPPGDDAVVVARLPDEFVLPPRMSRIVRISQRTYQHIVARRAAEDGRHVELVLRRLARVIEEPTHVGRLAARPERVELFSSTAGDPCGVCVSVKCLDGESWVNTAFPMGRKSLLKHLRTGRLRAVQEAQLRLFAE